MTKLCDIGSTLSWTVDPSTSATLTAARTDVSAASLIGGLLTAFVVIVRAHFSRHL